MELLREYQKEHPEECMELNRLKAESKRIDAERKARAMAKLAKVEKCRRMLNGGKC